MSSFVRQGLRISWGMTFQSFAMPLLHMRSRLSLAAQFCLAGAVVVLIAMVIVGSWVTTRIQEAVTHNAANATALYVESIIAPLAQQLATSTVLSDDARTALDEVLQQGALSRRLHSFKIWAPDGTVIYSTTDTIVGRKYPRTEGLTSAFAGRVYGEFDALEGEEASHERESGRALLEIYSPVIEPWSGRVMAVAEFYELADGLKAELTTTSRNSWLVVGGVTLAMFLALYGIVARGSREIERQRLRLGEKVQALSQMLAENRALRTRADEANHRTATLNERYLRRLSAELHDGPAQMLAFASLRLEALSQHRDDEDAELIRQSLDEAMRDIRNICRGLTLPELDELTTEAVVARAVGAHEAQAKTKVELNTNGPLPELTHAQKICVFRFIRETLSNASRHAQATRLRIEVARVAANLTIEVLDNGIGFERPESSEGLGLIGLKERLAGLGGRFELVSKPNSGTRVFMELPGRDA